MSKTFHHGERRIRVQGIRRETPDLRRLARALIDLAQAEAEAAAQAEHETNDKSATAKAANPKGVQSTPRTTTQRGGTSPSDAPRKEVA